MELIRGRWFEKYINSPEDKRDYDFYKRGILSSGGGKVHFNLAVNYVDKYGIPELTNTEKEEIAHFWGEYGVRIDDFSWHRMYYHVTGICSPMFVPDPIAGLVVYPYYNDHAYEYTWRDKNMFDRLLPNVPFPETYIKCVNGRIRNCQTGKHYSFEESSLQELMEELHFEFPSMIVVKPSRDSGFGRGVKKYNLISEADIIHLLRDWEKCNNFLIQKCIEQHEVLSYLNNASSNMIRVCSWRHGNNVDILFAAARVGITGSFTDICFVNGEERVNVVGITKEGYFRNKKLDQDGNVIEQYEECIRVPAWDKIVAIVKKNHLFIDDFNLVGWDFTIDKDENPVCFEWNIQWPGTVLYQFANGPLWGDKTGKILDFLKDKKNQDNFIPIYLKKER